MLDNLRIAKRLREAADRLDAQGDNAFRAAAFQRAADTAEASPRPLHERYERHGPNGLEQLSGIGPGIAGAISEMLMTGRWKYLERLAAARERVFTYVDDQGIEHDCVVLEPPPRSRLHGRDAIAALLRAK